MSEKLTEWFPAGSKPALVGVYQTRYNEADERTTYQHWDGMVWGAWMPAPHLAESEAGYESIRQSPQWRGLAESPEK